MQENKDMQCDEINFKEVFGHTLKSWKKWLMLGLAFALVLGMYKAVPALKTYSNPESRNNYLSANRGRIEYLQKEVNELQYQIDRQEDYFNNSTYINISPLQEQQGTISYYIYTTQSGTEFDYAKDVVHAYKNLFDSGKVAEYVHKHLSYDLEEEYIYELISVNSDENNKTDSYLDVKIVHDDEQKLQEIMQLVKNYIEENQPTVATQVGQHNLSLISSSTAVVTDNNITKIRADLDTERTTLQDTLATKQSELLSMQEHELSLWGIAKDILKYVIIGFLLGVLICAVSQAVYIILSNKVISANQLRNSKRLPVLGDFVNKKKLSKLAKVGYKFVGEDVDADFDDVLKVAAYNMVSLTENKNIILLDLVENDLSVNILNKITQYDFVDGIRVITDTKTLEKFDILEKLNDTTGVVIIAKKLGTKIPRLEREISIANSYGGELVGILLV